MRLTSMKLSTSFGKSLSVAVILAALLGISLLSVPVEAGNIGYPSSASGDKPAPDDWNSEK